MDKLEETKNIRKYGKYIISLVLAIISAISISVYIYSNKYTTYTINLNKNSKIYGLYINDNEQNLSNYANKYLVIDKKDSNILISKKDISIIIKTSIIDNVSISFSDNKKISVIRDGKINNTKEGHYHYRISMLDAVKKSLNSYTLLFLIISYIIMYLCINQINKFIKKVNDCDVKIKDIVKFFISNFIIFSCVIYLLLSVFKSLISIFILLYLIYLIYRMRDKIFNNLEYAYTILFTIIGLTFLFLIPPFNIPDEPEHFIKSYELFDKASSSDDGIAEISSNMYYFVSSYKYTSMHGDVKYNGKNYLNSILNKENTENKLYSFSYRSTKKSSILPYLPSAIIISIAKNLNFSPLLLLIFGRAINLMISLIICYYTLKIAPHFKKLFFIVMLLPTFIQESAGINMDWLTNSISILTIGYIMKLIYSNKKISYKEIITLFILGLILGFCKFGYFPIMFLIFLIPNKKIKNTKIKPILIKIVLIIFVIAVSYLTNTSMGGAVSESTPYYTIGYAISHPINTISVYLNTFLNRFDTDIFKGQFDSFGVYTKYNRSLLTTLLIIMYALVFLVKDKNDKKLELKERVIYLIISAMLILIPYTAMFLCWTFLGADSINGLQPRYFLIAELLLFIGISSNLLNLNIKNQNRFYVGCIIFNFCISLFTIIIGFY